MARRVMSEKYNDSCLRIFALIKMFVESDAPFAEVIKLFADENGNLIVSNNAGLSVSIPNDLIYHQDESQDAFGNQNIENINDNTMDIIGGNN